MSATRISIFLATCLMLTACDSDGDDVLDRMVADACDRLHAAWDARDHDGVERILPRLQQRAAEYGYSEREVGQAFDAQCDMPG